MILRIEEKLNSTETDHPQTSKRSTSTKQRHKKTATKIINKQTDQLILKGERGKERKKGTLSKILTLLMIHKGSNPLPRSALSKHRKNIRTTKGPGIAGGIKERIKLDGILLPALGDGADILVEAGDDRHVARTRLSRHPRVRHPPSSPFFNHLSQESCTGLLAF